MAMELTHTFTVPAPLDETWEAFQDIESVAGCFPGATVTSVDGDDFQGSCKVKLGPIALVYNGSGTFVEKDEAAKRFVVDAKGKDKRGNGTAGAKVTASFVQAADATEVTVVTDLAITGKPAQFGRGVIQDVSDKLLGQFVACLEQKVGGGGSAAAVAAAETVVGVEPVEPLEPAGSETPPPGEEPGHEPSRAEPAREAPRAVPPDDDALDLGATVLPILVRTYWKPALAALLVLLVIRRILRR
jgi:carbon monoxide dehydrogenase subunit G